MRLLLLTLVACFTCTFSSVLSAQQDSWKKHVIVPPLKSSINTVVANDFDRDGQIDVITSYNNQVIVLRGPDWEPQVVYTFPDKPKSNRGPRGGCIHSCLMDVDDDGDLDFCGVEQCGFLG